MSTSGIPANPTHADIDRLLTGFIVGASESPGRIARELNKARVMPPFGSKWTEASVAFEVGRMLAEGKLKEMRP